MGTEWNQVKRRRGRLRNIPTSIDGVADSLSDGIRPNPNPELSVDDLWKYHEIAVKDWQLTEWWGQLRQVLELASDKARRPVITKAVCLGPGPYEPSNGSVKARKTAHVQTAAFCYIVDHLSQGILPL